MRPSQLAASLAVLCLLAAVEGRAQSCIQPTTFTGVSIQGPKCGNELYPTRCEPGSMVTIDAQVYGSGAFPERSTCPTQISWTFGDGTAEVTNTSSTSVTHVYPALGQYSGKVTVQVQGAAKAMAFDLHIADGYFDTDRSTWHELTEGASTDITVTRTGDLSKTASVQYRTLPHTLLVPLSGTLVFGPGESSKAITVQAADDAFWNGGGRRFADLEIYHPGTYFFRSVYYDGGEQSITIPFEIFDNDESVRHRCTQSALSVSETAGSVSIEMERTGNLAQPTTGTVTPSVNLPIPHNVYSAEFLPGQTHATVQVPVIDDATYFGRVTDVLTCRGSGPGTQETPSSVTITIADDEPFPTLIAPASVEVDETDADQVLEIPISFVPPFGRPPETTVSLIHRTTSEDDVDLYSWWGLTSIRILIRGDNLAEPDESMVVRIAGEVSGTIPVVIRDDDRPPFPYAFDRDNYDAAEEESASVTIERSGDRSAGASLILHVRAAAPVQWDDTIPVAFAPGEASKTVLIPLQDDWYTGQRTATLELELDGFVGATAILTVNDDETVPSVSIGDAAVREGNLGQKTLLELPVTLSAPAGYDVKVPVAISHVTTDAADLTNTGAQTVTIFAGRLAAKAVFEIAGDIDSESDETFAVTITGCCGGKAAIGRGTATATILNDDGVPSGNVYRLVLGATQFPETDKWLTVTVKRFGRVQSAALTTLRLNAAPRHFEPRQVYFPPNVTEKEVRFYLDDFSYSGTVDGRLELFEGERLLESAAVKILDDEIPPRLGIRGFTVREGSQDTGNIRLTVTPASPTPYMVHLRTPSASASTSDYTPIDLTVEIPAGTASLDVPVTILDDAFREETERFYVDIVSVNGVATDLAPGSHSASCFIDDDDSGYLRYEETVPVETTTTITLELPPGAVAETLVIIPGDSSILEVPIQLAVTPGARSVSFQAKAHRAGATTFTLFLPAYLGSTPLTARITVAGPAPALTLSPAALQLEPGATARVDVLASPALAAWVLLGQQSHDLAVAAVDANPGAPGEARFLTVYAVAPGRTEITLTLASGASVTLPVVVAGPVSRRPGVHH